MGTVRYAAKATYDHVAGTVLIECADPLFSRLVANPVRAVEGTSLDIMEVHEIAKGAVRDGLEARGQAFDESETGLTVDHWLAGRDRREWGTRGNLVPADRA